MLLAPMLEEKTIKKITFLFDAELLLACVIPVDTI